MTTENTPATTDTALLVEGNLLAYGAGMSEQSRRDVKNAYHFATLVADKIIDVEKNGKAWYDKFLDAMRDIGFTTPRRSYERETSSEMSATLGAVAVRIISAAGSALLGGTAVAAVAKKALDKLTTIETDTRIVAHKKKSKDRGVVGLAACTETTAGDVVMVMSCVYATNPDLDEDVLGVQFKLNSSEYYSGTAVLTLNTFVYDKVRETVENKLGVRSIENVLQYDI